VRALANIVRPYAWGSRTAIASLQGRAVPSTEPEAELWMGAHPSAPSMLVTPDGGEVPLPDAIAQDPVGTLGPAAMSRFGARLPYLFKILAAAQPLSLQAHPDANQAAAGFAAERTTDPARAYVDPYHKPELLVAVEEFDALCGFRDPDATADMLGSFDLPVLAPLVAVLRSGPVAQRLRGAMELLVRWPAQERASLVDSVAKTGHALPGELARLYPGDVGVVVALLLNHVRLRPDEGVFMPAGNLHAYLNGVGVEVMAASDNVLRGGLTRKPVHVAELLRVLRYEVMADPVVRPRVVAPGVLTWDCPVREFGLVKLTGSGTLPGGGPRIVVCVRGAATLSTGMDVQKISGGESVFLAAAEPPVEVISDAAAVFQATCPDLR
jgi:mannose-6-phosphate isomerase